MRTQLIRTHCTAVQSAINPVEVEAALTTAHDELTAQEYGNLLGRLLTISSHPISSEPTEKPEQATGSSHLGQLYRVRIGYRALFRDATAANRSWLAEYRAVNAAIALAFALIEFRREISDHSIIKVWGLQVQVELSEDILRHELEKLLHGFQDL